MRSSIALKFLVAAALSALLLSHARADVYPNKPIRLLVGFVAGGGTDAIARQFAKELQTTLGQPVIVENRTGANGIIATQDLVRSPADGYTIMIAISSLVTNAFLYPKIAYDPMKDVTPLSVVATVPFVLTANPSIQVANIRELLALAKARPDGLSYGSAGSGSPPHLFQELMDQMAGIKTRHIPYKGSAPAMTDLLAGHLDLLWLTTVQALPYLKDGRLKPLAVSTTQPSPALPTVPTLNAAGVPGYDADMWWGFIAPKDLPKPIASILASAFSKIVASPSMRNNLVAQGAIPVGSTQEEFRALLEKEHEKWGRIVRERGIKGTE